MKNTAAAVMLVMALAACSFGKDVPAAESAIKAFHVSMNAGDAKGIYLRSANDMKQAATEEKMIAIFDAVHRKLGNFRSGQSAGWNENVNPSGHFITINYASVFDRGNATENFTYRINDGKAELAGYFVNSDALLTN